MPRLLARARIFSAAIALLFNAGCARPPAMPVATRVEGVKNVTSDGRVYIAGAPTHDGLSEMKRLGVTTIVDVRSEPAAIADEQAAARAIGLNYINIPIKSDGMTPQQADAISREMQKHASEKVLLHCGGGNRAGAAYGAWLGKSGLCTADEAITRAEKAGLSNPKLREDLRRDLSKPPAGQ